MADTAIPQVMMVDTAGRLRSAAATDVDALVQAGYRPASAEEQAQSAQASANEERFGGLTGVGLATAAGAARGLTAGLSDYALQGFGVEPETLQGLKEAQPAASTIGELGSALATLPKAGAQAGIGAAAKGLAPGLFGAAGRAVESKLGGKLLGKVAGGMAEGALWGAGNVVSESALGDPNLTAESALHEIGLSAAFGGGLGGLMHGVEKGIPKALGAAKSAVEYLDGKIDDAMAGKYPELAEKLSGVKADTIRDIWANRAELWTDPRKRAEVAKSLTGSMQAVKESGEEVQKIVAKELKPAEFEHAINSQVNVQAVQGQIDGLAKKMTSAIDEIATHPGDYYAGAAREMATLRDQLINESEDLLKKPWGKLHEVFNRIEDTKRNLWDLAKPLPETASMLDRRTAKLANGVWGAFKEGLEDASIWGSSGSRQAALNDAIHSYKVATTNLEKTIAGRQLQKGSNKVKVLKPESVNRWLNQMLDQRGEWQGEVIDEWMGAYKNLVNEADASYQARPLSENWNRQAYDELVGKTQQGLEQARVSAKTTAAMQQLDPASLASSWGSNPVRFGLTGGGHGGALGALGISAAIGPGAMAAVGAATTAKAALDFAGNPAAVIRTMMRLHETNRSVLKGIDTAAKALTVGAEVSGRTFRGPVGAQLASHDMKGQRKRFEERAAFIQQHSADLIGSLANATGSLHEHAPTTAAAMQMSAARKLQFLASKIPPSPSLGILGGQASPPAIEIARFNALVDAVDAPLETLHRASRGLATPEEIEAVRATSPALFAAYSKALIRHVAENEPRLTLAQKRAVARVTGQEMLTESAVYAAVQVAMQQSQAAQQQSSPMPQSGRTRKLESKAAGRLAPSGFGVGSPQKV